MCEIVYNILITNFTVHRCIIRSNAPSNLQMQPLGCIFVYALNCITFGTAIEIASVFGVILVEADAFFYAVCQCFVLLRYPEIIGFFSYFSLLST